MNYETAESPSLDEADGQDTEFTRELLGKNLVKTFSKEKIEKIGQQCLEGFKEDLRSREDWERDLDDWLDLAMQIREHKSFPWPQASNVKYPLLSTASMQFAARSYPSLVPSNGKVVVGQVVGKDPQGVKQAKADRVATYMSWQVLKDMDNWEEDMDKLLMMLPIIGTVFKKTYYDKSSEKVCSYLLSPKHLVVNYWATSLDNAERISEIVEVSPRVLKERQRLGIYDDVDLASATVDMEIGRAAMTSGFPQTAVDTTTPYQLIEQHTYYDADNDGYEEPYIVTFHRQSGKVLSIVPRFHEEQITLNDKQQIAKIDPIQYYTKFSFVPNPDGSFYDLGFGVLLGPINEAVNTLINQLVDAGTLSNLQSGFIGKGLKLKAGDNILKPGEWKPVAAAGDDLRKQIVPLPAKEPSNVLFELMGALVTSGKELASVAEIFTGKMPGQNTPATTTMATVEQGMKVFTAVYKRIFRSLTAEFKKIYKLNKLYLDPNTYIDVLDAPVGPDDFSMAGYDICPGADPTAVSQNEKLMKAQGLLELLPSGVLDPVKVVMRVLDAQEQPNWQELLNPQVAQTGQVPPQPDPKQMEMQMKMQMEQQKAGMKMQMDQQKMELEKRTAEQKLAMEQQVHAQKMQQTAEMAQVQSAAEIHKQRIFMAQEAVKGQQQMVQSDQQHQQKLQQTKESTKLASQKKSSSNGGGTK
jgi:chaperonin GroES